LYSTEVIYRETVYLNTNKWSNMQRVIISAYELSTVIAPIERSG
jgi:hypothetical protein